MAAEKPIISLAEYLSKPSKHAIEPGPAPVDGASSSRKASFSDIPAESTNIPPESRLVVMTDPRSPGADRIRYLRMQLRGLQAAAKLQSLVITSAIPEDGKSTLTMNLATALAEGGKKPVLVLEADLHQPSLAKALGLPPREGLAECLEKALDPLKAIRRVEPLNWYLLQAGSPESNPTELLQSGGFPKMLAVLAPHFDWILIDTPPVAPLTDALSLVREADAAVLVVRADVTPREAVEDAVAELGTERLAAIVLNGAQDLNRLYSKYSRYYGKS